MKIVFTLHRSSEWIKNMAITTGENYPNTVDVEVDSTALTEDQRSKLIQACNTVGLPKDTINFRINSDYELGGMFSQWHITTDKVAPTQEDAIASLQAAFDEIECKRAEKAIENAERLKQAEIKAQEEAAKAKALADARELLKDELGKLEEYKKYRTILSDVLSKFTPDELSSSVGNTDHSEDDVADACEYSLTFADKE